MRTFFKGIQIGDRVACLIPNGIGRNGVEYKSVIGTATILDTNHVVLNIGGKFGTPCVCNEKNFVKISRRASK